ncbi:hypothetical protein Pve01_67290 [Planomonospora venezuelensis]|nr:hypothetical protein Pve01_67290 [Planomonospora venezuelensis]
MRDRSHPAPYAGQAQSITLTDRRYTVASHPPLPGIAKKLAGLVSTVIGEIRPRLTDGRGDRTDRLLTAVAERPAVEKPRRAVARTAVCVVGRRHDVAGSGTTPHINVEPFSSCSVGLIPVRCSTSRKAGPS